MTLLRGGGDPRGRGRAGRRGIHRHIGRLREDQALQLPVRLQRRPLP